LQEDESLRADTMQTLETMQNCYEKSKTLFQSSHFLRSTSYSLFQDFIFFQSVQQLTLKIYFSYLGKSSDDQLKKEILSLEDQISKFFDLDSLDLEESSFYNDDLPRRLGIKTFEKDIFTQSLAFIKGLYEELCLNNLWAAKHFYVTSMTNSAVIHHSVRKNCLLRLIEINKQLQLRSKANNTLFKET
jgi:hypothetical protein